MALNLAGRSDIDAHHVKTLNFKQYYFITFRPGSESGKKKDLSESITLDTPQIIQSFI